MGKPKEDRKPTKDVNVVTFSGRVVADAQRRGKTTVFTLAVHEIDYVDGEPVEVTNFYDVTVFDPAADACATYVTKGKSLLVVGSLTFDEYEATYDDGETIYRDEDQEEPVMKRAPRILTSSVKFL